MPRPPATGRRPGRRGRAARRAAAREARRPARRAPAARSRSTTSAATPTPMSAAIRESSISSQVASSTCRRDSRATIPWPRPTRARETLAQPDHAPGDRRRPCPGARPRRRRRRRRAAAPSRWSASACHRGGAARRPTPGTWVPRGEPRPWTASAPRRRGRPSIPSPRTSASARTPMSTIEENGFHRRSLSERQPSGPSRSRSPRQGSDTDRRRAMATDAAPAAPLQAIRISDATPRGTPQGQPATCGRSRNG